MPMKLTRFIVVGTISAAFYFLLCYIQISQGIRPVFAGIIGYILTFGVTFYAQQTWTFKSAVPLSKSLPRYFVLQLSAAAASSGLTEFLANYYGWTIFTIASTVTIIAALASYTVSKFWVFRND